MSSISMTIFGILTYGLMGLTYAFFLYLAAVRLLDHAVNRSAAQAIANAPEPAPFERIHYSRCKFCEQRIIEGGTQLEAWQAYSRHVQEWHQS